MANEEEGTGTNGFAALSAWGDSDGAKIGVHPHRRPYGREHEAKWPDSRDAFLTARDDMARARDAWRRSRDRGLPEADLDQIGVLTTGPPEEEDFAEPTRRALSGEVAHDRRSRPEIGQAVAEGFNPPSLSRLPRFARFRTSG